jgi:hypothetical protein
VVSEKETEPESPNKANRRIEGDTPRLEEGLDYYLEDGLMVFTAHFLLRRGYCCESGCHNCPYNFDPDRATNSP